MIPHEIVLGCDPEFFLRRDGVVVGSEEVVRKGLESYGGKVIRDGVQAEINPRAHTCRQVLGENINVCLDMVRKTLDGMPGYTADFGVSVDLTRESYDTLSDDCKEFGCKPSYNLDPDVPQVIQLSASEYPIRSAGGHIHLGGQDTDTVNSLKNAPRIVLLLDMLLGNTMVLLDRSEGNIERRKHYGRAGEFRLPPYGIEYRTLSNFWLRHPVLFSLAFGLAREACDIMLNDMDDKFKPLVQYSRIREAIDTNNFALAMENFEAYKDMLLEVSGEDTRYPINRDNIDGFMALVNDGIGGFGDDVFGNWAECYDIGANGFLREYKKVTHDKGASTCDSIRVQGSRVGVCGG